MGIMVSVLGMETADVGGVRPEQSKETLCSSRVSCSFILLFAHPDPEETKDPHSGIRTAECVLCPVDLYVLVKWHLFFSGRVGGKLKSLCPFDSQYCVHVGRSALASLPI